MRSASFDKGEVIDSIMRAFWEHGYEATSIQTLEAATGLKRQSLYNAFGNKDAMFELAADRYDLVVSRRLLAALDNDDPRAALSDFFAAQLAVLEDAGQPAGCFVAGGQQELANRADTAIGEKMSALIGVQYSALVAAFERWKEQGALTDDADPQALAGAVMALVRGQSVLGRSQSASDIIARTAKTLPDLFERYYAH
ncbi:putative transcriptional regulator [Erythrobacter sp. NAP1]|uniref:TetR/AcrR family transcriptional regulator n=1 Tax=Erythrobacter sp. NAP1 TaxID=237727 RepID=UPI00006876F1|nr:TetR/AcrR family transcriptional regulator [Erythrobacter sp. NAP1]EAQ28116.1 putative transcriptional regulator [Erythrobacter sp. NAP1]